MLTLNPVDVMDYIDNACESLQRYFDVLETTGRYPQKEVTGLLLYCFIVDQVFDGPLSAYLDDEGLTAFNRAINCIASNGCLVDNSVSHVRITQQRPWAPIKIFRASEIGTQRSTEDYNIRSIDRANPDLYE